MLLSELHVEFFFEEGPMATYHGNKIDENMMVCSRWEGQDGFKEAVPLPHTHYNYVEKLHSSACCVHVVCAIAYAFTAL